jgi:hypothetical protein
VVLIRLRLWLGHVQHHLTDELLLVLQLLLLLLLLRSWLRLRLWHELHYRLQLLQHRTQPRKEEETQKCISSGEANSSVSNRSVMLLDGQSFMASEQVAYALTESR